MSSMVMYRSNSDHNVVCRDIWFRIKRNLGPFLQVLRSLKFLIFVNILVAALRYWPRFGDSAFSDAQCLIVALVSGEWMC